MFVDDSIVYSWMHDDIVYLHVLIDHGWYNYILSNVLMH